MASKVLMGISRDEVERARLVSEYKYELDTQSKVVTAHRKGWQEGQLEGRQEILDLLKSGMSMKDILKEYSK